MKDLSLATDTGLSRFLRIVAEASVRDTMSELDDERGEQDKKSDELDDYRAPSAGQKDDDEDVIDVEEAEDEDDEEKKPKKDLEKLGSANPNPDKVDIPSGEEVVGAALPDVVSLLNKIRSGKSLKDEKIKKELNDYISSLADGEKQSLFVFLSGLSQIMAGGVAGDDAPDPGRVGITVNAKTQIAEPKTSKAKKVTPSKISAGSATAAGEATPIIVGEVADKRKLLIQVRRLMK